MKAVPPALMAHYRSGSTTLARLWRIERIDGKVFKFTDHDETVVFEGETYEPSSVFDSSSLKSRADMSVDNMAAVGLLDSSGITAADMEAGLWDGAAFRIVEVNYRAVSMGANILRVGRLGEVLRQQGQYTVEMRGLSHYLQNAIGRIITSSCDANLGDDRCKVDLEALRLEAEVTEVTSNRTFKIAGSSIHVSAGFYLQFGEVTFSSGANEGLRREIKEHMPDGQIVLQLTMPYAIAVGDTLTAVPGCNKIHEVAENGSVTGDCLLKFDNVLNFRGFDAVPGTDQVLKIGGQ